MYVLSTVLIQSPITSHTCNVSVLQPTRAEELGNMDITPCATRSCFFHPRSKSETKLPRSMTRSLECLQQKRLASTPGFLLLYWESAPAQHPPPDGHLFCTAQDSLGWDAAWGPPLPPPNPPPYRRPYQRISGEHLELYFKLPSGGKVSFSYLVLANCPTLTGL